MYFYADKYEGNLDHDMNKGLMFDEIQIKDSDSSCPTNYTNLIDQ